MPRIRAVPGNEDEKLKSQMDFADRRQAAKDAKTALLDKAKAWQNDPKAQARRTGRAAVVAAREEREAAKRRQREREQAERQLEVETQRAAAEEVAVQLAASEQERLIAQALADQAAQKAKRDTRYAARQSRKG